MPTLNTETRKEIGEKINILRKNNYLPAIVYGKEIGSLPIKVKYKDFEETWEESGEGTIISLRIKKGNKRNEPVKQYPVLIREVQKNPLTGEFLHIDFYQLPMDKEVEVTIPLVFKGELPAEKEIGGVLIKNIHEVKIKGLPKNLISSIQVNISSLAKIEDSIKIKDLPLPEGIRIIADSEEIVALVGKAEEEKIEAVPEEVEPKEVEVISQKKEEEQEIKIEEEKEDKEDKKERPQEKPSPPSK